MTTHEKENMIFLNDQGGHNLGETRGWTTDCNMKRDYDPTFIRGISRVYSDGNYTCSLYLGGERIRETAVLRAGSVDEAKAACEAWMEDMGRKIRKALEGI